MQVHIHRYTHGKYGTTRLHIIVDFDRERFTWFACKYTIIIIHERVSQHMPYHVYRMWTAVVGRSVISFRVRPRPGLCRGSAEGSQQELNQLLIAIYVHRVVFIVCVCCTRTTPSFHPSAVAICDGYTVPVATYSCSLAL